MIPFICTVYCTYVLYIGSYEMKIIRRLIILPFFFFFFFFECEKAGCG
jgi:hypothetical protein